MLAIEKYQNALLAHLGGAFTHIEEPKNLYDPIKYILNLGGKRLRPVLTLMAADIFGNNYNEALDAAFCVEVFHNFTLVHDDIMDDAPLRRGKATVHEKWNVNTGILSGDAMLILAYQLLESYPPEFYKALNTVFTKTALEVCEGQQYDVDFETRTDVTITEYIKMIEYKTAVLVGAALKMGAIVGKATKQDQDTIYEFGKHLGIAFQLQDDFLDAFGNPETFGKQVGGDIIENKKTYLYLKALEFSSEVDKLTLQQLFQTNPKPADDKIAQVKSIFQNSGAANATKQAIEQYTHNAFSLLDYLDIPDTKKDMLRAFGNYLMNRSV